MATSGAEPALAQIVSLSFKGFNYVSYYNGGYANADSLPALAGTGANALAIAFEYGIDVKNSAVYADANYTDSQSVIAATIAEANSRRPFGHGPAADRFSRPHQDRIVQRRRLALHL